MSEQSSGRGTLYLPENLARPQLMGPLQEGSIRCHTVTPQELGTVFFADPPTVVVMEAEALRAERDVARWIQGARSDCLQFILLQDHADGALEGLPEEMLFACLPSSPAEPLLRQTIRRAFEHLLLLRCNAALEEELARQNQELRELHQIGIALSAERNLDTLLELILQKSREITRADAGSLYLIEETDQGERQMRFKLSQNDSFDLNYEEFTLPLSKGNLAGYVAVTGNVLRLDDVYHLPDGAEYRFNRSFDEATGYRTRSMLAAPMKNKRGDILGVIQLINRKPAWEMVLRDAAMIEREVRPFDDHDQDLVLALASQAAVAYENNLLYQSIENIFETFMKASVKAIELRDPTTSGHSERVARLTLGLAGEVNCLETGTYRDTFLTPEQLKELRYAALLHDFGKIGVRENVLVKAKKLYEYHLQLIQERFDFVKRTLEAEYSRRKLDFLMKQSREDYLNRFTAIDEEYRRELEMLDEYFQTILLANEPTVLVEGSFARLAEIAARTYIDIYGQSQKLLQPEEVRRLSIRKGSLDEAERVEIESHVTHSFRFLSEIAWSKDLKNIPEIAYAHHEKLDGSGYPRGLNVAGIPVQARMMTIADIYDALTAADRPYKKAQPIERALDILGYEVEDGHIDRELVDLFIKRRVYELTRAGSA